MRAYMLKGILPFALTLLVGVVLVQWLRHHRQSAQPPAAPPTAQKVEYVASLDLTARPELHVLSTNLVEENVRYTRDGRAWTDLQVLEPPGVLYTKAERKSYRQGVMQVRVLFGADGTVSQIEPLRKRDDCGACLPAQGNVSEIDPTAEQSRAYVAAATAAVRQIKFVPCKSAGQFVPTHGLIECVFRLD